MINIFILIGLTIFAFWPCFTAGFVYWDDDLHLFENPVVLNHSIDNLGVIFSTVVNKTYIALTILSFNIEHYFFGLNAFVYHLDNIILHILICTVSYILFIRMGIKNSVAGFAALLFAIHPMHVESVAWVTQRKDVLYSLFYLLCILQYWKYLTLHQSKSFTLSLFFGLLSILAKPMALSLPLTLILFDWYYQGRITKQAVINKWPFFITILPVAWITYQCNSRTMEITVPESLLIWAWSATFYIKKFFTPFVLLPLYQLPQPVSLLNPSYASSVLIIAAAPLIIFRLRKDRLFILAVLFYILSTFFLWRYDNTVDVTIVGDRFMYLPSVGLCLWLASILDEKISANKPIWRAAVCAIILGMLLLTIRQCQIWRNDISLWEHEIKFIKSSALAYNSYGVALSKANRPRDALMAVNRSIEINPKYALAYYNRGRILVRQGQNQEALADFTKAIALNPYHFNSFLERGTLLSRQEKYFDALDDVNTALQLDPQNAGIYNNRGIVYKKLGRINQALEDFSAALRLNPKLGSAYINRANIWKMLNNPYKENLDLQEARRLGAKI
jgi:tetratricopeptide (TPR) repeat protein